MMIGDDIPSETARSDAYAALITILRSEDLQPHNELLMVAHALACCAVALGADETLARSLVRVRYQQVSKRSPPGKRPPRPDGGLTLPSADDFKRIALGLTEWLDGAKVPPHNQVWLLSHMLCELGWSFAVDLPYLDELVRDRFAAAAAWGKIYRGLQ